MGQQATALTAERRWTVKTMSDEYIKREDAVNVMYTFLKQAHDMDNNNDRLEEVLTIAKNVVHEIPSADVVEVVRCGDCVWWTKQEASCQGRCARLGIYPTGVWYCANGAKMDEETE